MPFPSRPLSAILNVSISIFCVAEFVSDILFLFFYSVHLNSYSSSQSERAEQSRRTRILLPNSMPLSHYLRVIARALLLLLCSSSISCLGDQWHDCRSVNSCGTFSFGYPFGIMESGCGDPDFQLDCDHDHDSPLLNIIADKYLIADKYHISDPSLLENSSSKHIMTIVIDNICTLSGNDIKTWLDGPGLFNLAAGYTYMRVWGHCNHAIDNNSIFKVPESESVCPDLWYYTSEVVTLRGCEMRFEVPIKGKILPGRTFPWKLDFEITWSVDWNKDQSCGACLKTNGSCGYNNISEPPEPFVCYCPDGTSHPHKCPSKGGPNKSAIIIGCSIGGVALTAIALVLFLKLYGKRRKTPSRGLASGDMEAAVLPRRQISNLPIFSYEELRQATNCFHEENELGDGGFGSVYLGKLSDGRTVAVKRLYQDNSRRLEQFLNEVKIFSTLNHPRVVRLYGCTSADSPELLLVYEFVSNGTLADHLHGDRRGPRGLPWDARLNIAIQTAEALDFLHSVDPPIFHRDVKSTNILLDENLNVKVADFGLCRLVPVNASHVTTAPQGTPGYVDPEYHQCYQLTEKSDVYSFGVVLVEIISAKLAVDINRNRKEISLANMAKSKIQEGALNELVDPQLGIEMNHEVKVTVSAVAELAFRCLASERDYRPHMKEVVAQLREIKQSWDTSTGPGDQQWGSFSNTKESLSPISVQDKWSSKSSTPNASA